MNIFCKKFFFITSIFFFDFSLAEISRKINQLIYDLVDSSSAKEEDVKSMVDLLIRTLSDEKEYEWEFQNLGLSEADYSRIAMNFFDFYNKEIEGKANVTLDEIKRKFLLLPKTESDFNGKVSMGLLSFLYNAYEIIGNRIKTNKFDELQKKRAIGSRQSSFDKLKILFSPFFVSGERDDRKVPLFSFSLNCQGSENIRSCKATETFDIGKKLREANNFEEFFAELKKKISSGAKVAFESSHLNNYDFQQLKELKAFLVDIKSLLGSDAVVSCQTNFSDVAALYRQVFGGKAELSMIGESLEADSFVAADSFLRHSGILYKFPNNATPFSVDSLGLSGNQPHKIYFFIDEDASNVDYKSFLDFVENFKLKNRFYQLEVIPVFQDNVKKNIGEVKSKKIPSLFDQFSDKEKRACCNFSEDQRCSLAFLVKAMKNVVEFRDLKNIIIQSENNFEQLQQSLIDAYAKKCGNSFSFMLKNKEIKNKLEDRLLFYFEDNAFVSHQHEIRDYVRAYIAESADKNILFFNVVHQLKEAFTHIDRGSSPDLFKQRLMYEAQKNIEAVVFDPVFSFTKKYAFFNAYELQALLEKEVKQELTSLYTMSERDTAHIMKKVQTDIDNLFNSIIEFSVNKKAYMPVVFVGPRSLIGEDVGVIKNNISNNVVAETVARKYGLSKKFSLRVLSHLPLPYYFSVAQKEKIIKFLGDKFKFYSHDSLQSKEDVFFNDNVIIQDAMREVYREIELLPKSENGLSIQHILVQGEGKFVPLFLRPGREKTSQELSKINFQQEENAIAALLLKKIARRKFFSEDVRKIRLVCSAIGLFGDDQILILESILGRQKTDQFSQKTVAEITDYICDGIYYSCLEKKNSEVNYTLSKNPFFSIQPYDYKYDRSFLHSRLAKHINEQFSIFKKNRDYRLMFNIGGVTGSGKSQGVHEVRMQLKEITGKDPVVIVVKDTRDEYVGADHKYLEQLRDECRKFISQGKYVILNFDEIDALLGQGSGKSAEAARDAQRSSKFKQQLQLMIDEFGSHIVFYSTSNHRMIMGADKSGDKNDGAVQVEDAILGRIGSQLWLKYVEPSQYNLFSRRQVAQIEKSTNAYGKNVTLLSQSFDQIKHQGGFDFPGLRSCVNDVLFGLGSKERGLREEAYILKLLEHIEKRNETVTIDSGIRSFVAEESKKNFKEYIDEVWKDIKITDFTQPQQKKSGEMVGKILSGGVSLLSSGGGINLDEKTLTTLAKAFDAGGAIYDNRNAPEEDRQNLALRSEKTFMQTLLAEGSSVGDRRKALNKMLAHSCIRSVLNQYNSSGMFTLTEIEGLNDFIYKETFGVPLNKKTVTNGVQLRTWFTFEKMKNKLPHLYKVIGSLDQEKFEYYKEIFLNQLSFMSEVNKTFAINRLKFVNDYLADELNKKKFLALIEDNIQAKVTYNQDPFDNEKMQKVNETHDTLLRYIAKLYANATMKVVQDKVQDSTNSFKNIFGSKKMIG